MPGCVLEEPVLLVPLAGPLVQRGHQLWLGAAQALAQQVDKEVVIAVLAPLLVQGDDEQVGAVQGFQEHLAAAGSSLGTDGFTQRCS